MKKITINDLMNWKQEGRKFATSTAYDASFAQLFESEEMQYYWLATHWAWFCKAHVTHSQ